MKSDGQSAGRVDMAAGDLCRHEEPPGRELGIGQQVGHVLHAAGAAAHRTERAEQHPPVELGHGASGALPDRAQVLLVAPEGVPHGVRNPGPGRLLVLAILAPAP